jgi:hypothetical protein
MNRLRKTSYFKVISVVLIGLFLYQGNALLSQGQADNLNKQLERAENDYKSGNYKRSIMRLKRLAAACENIGTHSEDIISKYGLALLFLGICHESLGESRKAGKYYKQAKKLLHRDSPLPNLDLKRYNKIRDKILNKAKTPLKTGKTTGKIIAKEKPRGKKKKFPWLLVAGGAALAVVVYLVFLKRKPEYTLTASVGEGVDGSPATGTSTHKKGTLVNYNYTLESGYTALVVTLDGREVPASGTIKMDGDHILTAAASKNYTLTVAKGEGVEGTPDSGTFFHEEGETVTYDYRLQPGYTDLIVRLDGIEVPASGSILMNQNHTLTASAEKTYTLTVSKGEGVIGIPDTGTFSYKQGDIVFYNYSLDRGYKDLVVRIDGNQAAASGTITMNKDHTLSASADVKSITAAQK